MGIGGASLSGTVGSSWKSPDHDTRLLSFCLISLARPKDLNETVEPYGLSILVIGLISVALPNVPLLPEVRDVPAVLRVDPEDELLGVRTGLTGEGGISDPSVIRRGYAGDTGRVEGALTDSPLRSTIGVEARETGTDSGIVPAIC